MNGGSTTTSAASSSGSLRPKATFCTRPMASRWVRFIFQLPAMSGRRPGDLAGSCGPSAAPSRARPDPGASCPPGTPATRRRRWRCGRSGFSSSPSARTAAAESPPPTTDSPSTPATASATPRVPAVNGASSNTPIGPFQKTVLRVGQVPGEQLDRVRPDVQALEPVRDRLDRRPSPAASATTSAQTTSIGSTILSPASSSNRRQVSTWSALQQRVADPVALRGEEREAHAAADQQPVDLGQQRLDDGQLVADLRAAEHHDVGPLPRLPGQPVQHARARAHQPARSSAAAAARRRRPRRACGAPPRRRRRRRRAVGQRR